jgi:hypothetical protein
MWYTRCHDDNDDTHLELLALRLSVASLPTLLVHCCLQSLPQLLALRQTRRRCERDLLAVSRGWHDGTNNTLLHGRGRDRDT